MWLYVSEHEKFNDFGNEHALIWQESNIPYAVWGPESTRSLSTKYYPSEVSLVAGRTRFEFVNFLVYASYSSEFCISLKI